MSSHCYPIHQVMTGCNHFIAMCVHLAKLFQEWRGLRAMTRQTNVPDCKPIKLLALPHIEIKLAQTWLQEFYERQKISINPEATLSLHHVPVINDGFATHDRNQIVSYSKIRLEPDIFRQLRMKIQHHICPDMMTIRLNYMWF